MHLGQVLTTGAHAFPHESHGVEPEDSHALVGEVQDRVDDGEQDLGVFPVQVPLVFVEGRPDPFPDFRVEGEVAGGLVGKDLDEGLFILFRQAVVVEHAIEGLVEGIAGLRLFRPFMFLGRVVQHHVDAGCHPSLAESAGDGLEILHRAKRGVDGAVVHHRIAAVGLAGAGFQARHQVDIGDAEPLEIVDMGGQVAQRAGEAVDVRDVGHLVLREEPVRVDVAVKVERAQVGRAFGRMGGQQRAEAVHQGGDVVGAIETGQRADDVARAAGPAQVEQVVGHRFCGLAGRRFG